MATSMNPVQRELIEALENETVPPSLALIRAIVELDPQVLRSKFVYHVHDGYTPLHLALRNRHIDDRILQYLMDQWSDSVYIPATGGVLPIHMAFGSGCLLSTIQKMVRLHPESLEIASTFGLPFHYAVFSKNSNLDTVKFLFQQNPMAIHEKAPFNGSLPIHTAIISESEATFSIVQFLANADRRTLLVGGKDGNLPIHTACHVGAAFEIVEYLVSRCPQSLEMKNHHGMVPLVSACHGKASVQVLKYLLERKGNMQVDHLLHECYQKYNPKEMEFVQYLIKKIPTCVMAKNPQGELPLHKALTVEGHDTEKHRHVELLVRAYPNGLFVKSNRGMTPLDLFLRSSNNCSDKTQHFLEEEMKTILGDLLKNVAEKFGIPEDALCHNVLPFCV